MPSGASRTPEVEDDEDYLNASTATDEEWFRYSGNCGACGRSPALEGWLLPEYQDAKWLCDCTDCGCHDLHAKETP